MLLMNNLSYFINIENQNNKINIEINVSFDHLIWICCEHSVIIRNKHTKSHKLTL